MIVTDRKESLKIFDAMKEKRVCGALFCTASYWNTEAILLSASRFAQKRGMEFIPVVVATTFQYTHMPQAQRFTYEGSAKAGFLSHMAHLRALAADKYAPYANVIVLPHMDHADPVRDAWALKAAVPYLSSAMFDAQTYPYAENLDMTAQYVREFGKDILVEGIIETLSVGDGTAAVRADDYCERAEKFVKHTGVDFLVADLGTEQQSACVGNAKYNRARALALTQALGDKKLVLHGTSCLTPDQFATLPDDGVVRVNMWTRVAREAGQYAAQRLCGRMDKVLSGDFEAAESRAYMVDWIDKAADVMEEMLLAFGYDRW